MIPKLIIGTANFGLRYGIANDKKLGREEIFSILDCACSLGIQGIDTARAYGDAENIIGEFFAKRGKVFKVINKLAGREYASAKEVEDEVYGSMKALQVPFIDVFLLHSFDSYKNYGHIILPVLRSLVRDNIIGSFGVSVYHPAEVAEISRADTDSPAIEFPLNLFDQRFSGDPVMQKLRNRGSLLFARSVFLQGLFFLSEAALCGKFEQVRGKVREIGELSSANGIRPECLALLFAASKPWVDGVVVGIDSVKQLISNHECFRAAHTGSYAAMEPSLSGLAVHDEDIILPYKWHSAGNI